jgi:hypothetical protein
MTLPIGSRNFSDQVWVLWLKWGLGLARDDEGDLGRDPRLSAYRDALQAAQKATSASDRLAACFAALESFLRGSDWSSTLLDWAAATDLARLGGTACYPGQSPVLELNRQLGTQGARDHLTRHALLGICLATDDLRGQLGLVYSLPSRSLSSQERLWFLYPVPTDPALLDILADGPLDMALLLAIARNESLFDSGARSRAGALGLMQIMPFNYEQKGFLQNRAQWRDPTVSLRTAIELLARYSHRFDADPYRTVAAYNAGPQAAVRWTRQLGGRSDRDLFLAWIGYPDTKTYTEKVLIERAIYDWILQQGNFGTP